MNDTKVLAIVMVLAACLGLAWLYRPVVLNGVLFAIYVARQFGFMWQMAKFGSSFRL